jgi:hypothetical protein
MKFNDCSDIQIRERPSGTLTSLLKPWLTPQRLPAI